MTQQLTFEGLRRRDAGIASLERHPWLYRARQEAELLGRVMGTITSDDVQRAMADDPPPHLNCWGALFHDKRFRWTGSYVKSQRREAHARDIKVWRLA